jgi:hypothetical protein
LLSRAKINNNINKLLFIVGQNFIIIAIIIGIHCPHMHASTPWSRASWAGGQRRDPAAHIYW